MDFPVLPSFVIWLDVKKTKKPGNAFMNFDFAKSVSMIITLFFSATVKEIVVKLMYGREGQMGFLALPNPYTQFGL